MSLRNGVVQFRVSSEERSEMERLAGLVGLSLSEWLRMRGLGCESSSDVEALGLGGSDPAPVAEELRRPSAKTVARVAAAASTGHLATCKCPVCKALK